MPEIKLTARRAEWHNDPVSDLPLLNAIADLDDLADNLVAHGAIGTARQVSTVEVQVRTWVSVDTSVDTSA